MQPVTGALELPSPNFSRKRSWNTWLYLGGGIFSLLLLVGICTPVRDLDTKTPAPANLASAGDLSGVSERLSERHNIGDDVFVGYWAYRCVSTQWQKSIGTDYTREYPDAAFLLVELAVRNNDKTASVPAPAKLVDSEGREYDESSKGVFLENSFGVLKNLNPGVSSHGYIVFDVPPGRYALKVSGGFVSGKSELIDLQ